MSEHSQIISALVIFGSFVVLFTLFAVLVIWARRRSIGVMSPGKL